MKEQLVVGFAHKANLLAKHDLNKPYYDYDVGSETMKAVNAIKLDWADDMQSAKGPVALLSGSINGRSHLSTVRTGTFLFEQAAFLLEQVVLINY